jgi:hypothetical protein
VASNLVEVMVSLTLYLNADFKRFFGAWKLEYCFNLSEARVVSSKF